MSLKNFNQPQPEQNDNHLMCGVPGCNARWTVHMEGHRPMCSFHQWQGKDLKPKAKKAEPPASKSIAQWYNDSNEIY